MGHLLEAAWTAWAAETLSGSRTGALSAAAAAGFSIVALGEPPGVGAGDGTCDMDDAGASTVRRRLLSSKDRLLASAALSELVRVSLPDPLRLSKLLLKLPLRPIRPRGTGCSAAAVGECGELGVVGVFGVSGSASSASALRFQAAQDAVASATYCARAAVSRAEASSARRHSRSVCSCVSCITRRATSRRSRAASSSSYSSRALTAVEAGLPRFSISQNSPKRFANQLNR